MNSRFKWSLLSIATILVGASLSGNASADPLRVLSPLELFSRCYTHITQLRLPPNQPKRAAVIAGTLSPVDACMQILAEANLNSSTGKIANTVTLNGVNESLAVLQNFNSLHLNFTGNSDLQDSVPFGIIHGMLRTFLDETVYALYFTQNLFTPGATVDQIVTGTSPMEAVRSNGRYTSSAPNPYVLLGVQTGTFQGVKLMPADKLAATAHMRDDYLKYNATQKGGIIGDPAYLSLNFSGDERKPNGGLAVPRRWAKAVYSDLLCRQLPVVRLSDGTANIELTTSSSTPPFRTGAKCMQCHASVDSAAGTARNFFFVNSYDKNSDSTWAEFLKHVDADQSPESGVVDADPDWYRRPPNGRFFFRSYDGTLNDTAVTSIADLGNKIAQTNDFYACTAAKYFKYFTGITANLQDIGDPGLAPLTPADLYYRNLVIKMGQNLKSKKNLQSLIRDILSSAPYQRESLRSDGK
jgi:hypothetical protein